MYYICKMCNLIISTDSIEVGMQLIGDHISDHIQEAGSGVA